VAEPEGESDSNEPHPFTYTQGGAATVNLFIVGSNQLHGDHGLSNDPDRGADELLHDPQFGASAHSRRQFPVPDPGKLRGNDRIGESLHDYLPNGQIGTQTTPTSYTSAVGYTAWVARKWHITGYCIEQDKAGQIKSTVYDGNYSIELDCDNGSNSAGNSSISTRFTCRREVTSFAIPMLRGSTTPVTIQSICAARPRAI